MRVGGGSIFPYYAAALVVQFSAGTSDCDCIAGCFRNVNISQVDSATFERKVVVSCKNCDAIVGNTLTRADSRFRNDGVRQVKCCPWRNTDGGGYDASG